MLPPKTRVNLLILVSVMAVAGLALAGPIAQDPGYHQFADSRTLAGISNFWNVISNIPFLIVGLMGFRRYRRLIHRESQPGYAVLCAGIFFVGLGSAYYHQAPGNATLLWDRLPMTVTFMALLSMLLGERVIPRHKTPALWLLVLFGMSAVLYWAWSESHGRGDLRPYALVQFLPMILIPLILVLYPARYLSGQWLVGAFGWYVLAKALEHYDAQILVFTGSLSGHPLKHLAGAAAALCILLAVPAKSAAR